MADSDRTHSEAGDPAAIEVTVPGHPTYLEVLRGAAARIGYIALFTYDGVEDVALAVTEAASLLMRASPTQVSARMTIDADGVDVEIKGQGLDGSWPVPGMQSDAAWQILVALSDDLSLAEDGVSFRQMRR